mgnify:CR=1 FL=1
MNEEKIKCLLLINENKKITVTALAKKMNVSKATMSRMVSSFYEEGYTLEQGKCLLSKKGKNYIEETKRKIKNFQTYKKSKLIFQILYLNSSYYLTYLKQINKETEIAEYILKKSMKNKELLKLLSLEKSLVYFTTSLKSNELVMEKTMRGKIIKLYEEDEDILEDAITENKQAIEMSKIYSDILNGTMDAYASIISNNLNGVMKFLTSITIVLAVPTMVSSFWGMNVNLPFQDSKFGFPIMILISVALTLIVTWWLKRKDMLD